MKKLTSLLLAMLMLLSLAACGGTTESSAPESSAPASDVPESSAPSDGSYSGPEYELQLGHIGADGSIEDTVTKRFAELVSEASGGKINVTIYGNSQMGGLNDLVDALRYDTLDMAIFAMGNAESYFPKGTIQGFPYLISSYEHAEALYKSDVYKDLCDELAAATNLRELGAFHVGFRIILSNVKIENVDDMQGITMRVPEVPLYVTTFGLLGCNTIAIPANEVYQALQTGLIDATEAAPTYMVSMNYHEVSQYASLTNHIYTGNGIYISQSKLDSLDPAAAEIIQQAATTACEEAWTIVEDEESAAIQTISDAGVEIVDVDLETFSAVMQDVWDALNIDQIDGGQELLDAILALRP